ncbi:hypothetical protein GA0115255_110965 [Streptomyces sp. Ncost-T6T-2b]|nr:hypothetical protein GA0115255_110965 [Streptomyces sp. Ncost-T6T-2b]
MALRIHFTADDLARITVAPRPDPMWELVNSLHALQARQTASEHAPWIRHVRKRLARSDLRGPIRLLTTLVPPRGNFPDFLTPPHQGGMEAARDLIRATPAARLRSEIASCAENRKPPSTWLRRLAEGERGARQELDGAVLTYFRELLAPQLHLIDDVVHADRALHSRNVRGRGSRTAAEHAAPVDPLGAADAGRRLSAGRGPPPRRPGHLAGPVLLLHRASRHPHRPRTPARTRLPRDAATPDPRTLSTDCPNCWAGPGPWRWAHCPRRARRANWRAGSAYRSGRRANTRRCCAPRSSSPVRAGAARWCTP